MLTVNISISIYLILYYFVSIEVLNVEAQILQSGKELKVGRVEEEMLPCRLINDCEIRCLPSNLGGEPVYTAAIESIYNDAVTSNADCALHGVKLFLPKQAICGCVFLMKNFLKAKIKIKELDADIYLIAYINSGAFGLDKFSEMKSLTLRNGNFYELFKSAFEGLPLEKLVLTNHSFDYHRDIERGVLELVGDTLKSFTLIEPSEQIQIPIERILGSESKTLSNMEYVKIQYKMNSTNGFTFTAIPNVIELDLSGSHISAFDDKYVFDTLTKLEILNLENNQLKTLPFGIFAVFFTSIPAQFLSIRLSGNPWICGCDLKHLKYLLGNYSNFEGNVLCDTPTDIHNYPIKEAIFCPLIQTTSSSLSPTTIISKIDSIEKDCISYIDHTYKEQVLIQSQLSNSISISTLITGEVSIALENYNSDLLLIWISTNKIRNNFPVYQANDNIECISNVANKIVLKNLIDATQYTFCLMHRRNSTASPLDCVSYYHEVNKSPWLFESSQSLTFGIMSAVLLGSILIGSLIGIYVGKKYIIAGEEFCCTIEKDSMNFAENHNPPPLPQRSRCNSYAYVT